VVAAQKQTQKLMEKGTEKSSAFCISRFLLGTNCYH
jgi:hypothetical protein